MLALLDHLRSLGLSGASAKDALQSGKVYLNGIPTGDAGRQVDPAAVALRPNAPRLIPGKDLFIVFRDAHLAVVWKPAGMLSVPAPRAGGHKNAVGYAGKILGGETVVVHRLDEDTSGLLLVARTEQVAVKLKSLIERHEVDRRYLAIVAGGIGATPRRVESLLIRDRGDGLRGTAPPAEPGCLPDPTGKKAITHLRGIEELGTTATLVEARLETGRTHQVRIHCAESRHPILGDPLYASRPVAQRSPRLALHAASLAFIHPITAEPLRLDAPLADDLEQLRRRLLRDDGPARGPRR